MLIDSHCHLDFSDFKEDMPLVLQRAKESGVGVMQTICTRLSRFPEVLALTSQEDNIYCSVGIHPHNVEEEPEFRPLRVMITVPRVGAQRASSLTRRASSTDQTHS